MISAATGEGVDDLLAATADRLPHPEVELTALVPYARGDLIDRAHREAEILDVDHLPQGTRLHLRAAASLAHALAPHPPTRPPLPPRAAASLAHALAPHELGPADGHEAPTAKPEDERYYAS